MKSTEWLETDEFNKIIEYSGIVNNMQTVRTPNTSPKFSLELEPLEKLSNDMLKLEVRNQVRPVRPVFGPWRTGY